MNDPKQVLDNLFDGLYTVTTDRKITYWNQSAQNITGYSAEQMVGTYCYDSLLKHVDKNGKDLCNDGCPLSWAIKNQCKHEDDIFLRHRDGFRVPITVRVSPLYDADGQVTGASELFQDNTPSGAMAERLAELEELAMVDPLTKLANEKYAREQIELHIKEMHRNPYKIGIAIFKIDNIQALLDDYGKKGFDQLQIIAGHTLKRNCRPLDIIAKLNDGEFLGIFRNVSENLLLATCEKMRFLFKKSDFPVNKKHVSGTLSAGGHCLKPDDDYEKVISLCRRYVSNNERNGGDKTKVNIRLVAK